jgi:hypothetical protein
MATVRRRFAVLLSDPQSARVLALGLALIGLLVSLGAPGVVAASPPGDGGIGGS